MCELFAMSSRSRSLVHYSLNDEGWTPLPEGCALAVRGGEELCRRRTVGSE